MVHIGVLIDGVSWGVLVFRAYDLKLDGVHPFDTVLPAI